MAHAWTVMHTKALEGGTLLSYVASGTGMDDEDHKESRGLAMLHATQAITVVMSLISPTLLTFTGTRQSLLSVP